MSEDRRRSSISSDASSIKSTTEFVDLDKLSTILSAGTEKPKTALLIPSSGTLTRSLSDSTALENHKVLLKPFSYNKEHINLLAKSLHLINDSYKDVRVNMPLKENIKLLEGNDGREPNPGHSPTSAHHFDHMVNNGHSTSTSSLKSCMKRQDEAEKDNDSGLVDELGLVNFKPVVSFDTVPLGSLSAANIDNNIIPPEEYYTEDEWYDNELDEPYQDTYVGYRGHDNSNYTPAPTFQNVTASGSNLIKGLQKLKILEGYSTTPYINNSALIINKKHPYFDQLESDIKRKKTTVLKKRKYALKPLGNKDIAIDKRYRHGTKAATIGSTDIRARTLRKINREIGWNNQGRSILVHISGRRHSWVAIDYAVSQLVNNGDCLIITCNLPIENASERMMRRKNRVNRKILLSKMRSRMETDDDDDVSYDSDFSNSDSDDDMYDRSETHWKNGYTYNEVEETLTEILKYIHLILPSDRVIKLTCEISVDNTKDALINAYNCYLPKLILTTSKKWQHDEILGDHKSKLLADVLTCHFPVPIVVIPVKKSDNIENYIKERLHITTNLKLSVQEKIKKLVQLNNELLLLKRPLLPFMLILKTDRHDSDSKMRLNKELHLEEFMKSNVTCEDHSASEHLSSILDAYKQNLDQGLQKIDEKYPSYSDTTKSIEICDLIADQSAKYNENFNKITSKTEVDTKLALLKNVLSQGEHFKTAKKPESPVSKSSFDSISSKPPVNRTIRLEPINSHKLPLNSVQSNNNLRRYKTLSTAETLSHSIDSSEKNTLKKTLTNTSEASSEKKKKSKFSFKSLFKRS